MNAILEKVKNWFDYKKIYSSTEEKSNFWGVFLRCMSLAVFIIASLFCKWLVLPALVLSLLYILFENGINKLSYVIFLMPLYNLFRLDYGNLYFIAYALALAIILLALQILISYIKKENRIPWKKLIVIGAVALYFILPLRPTSLSVLLVVCANVGLIAVCLLGEWKHDFKLYLRLFTYGVIISSVCGIFAQHIPRILEFVGYFLAKLPGVLRLSGLDADPNYYSMGVTFALAGYLLLYFKNRVSTKEFFLMVLFLSIFGFMTISKTFYIIYAIYLVLLVVVLVVKYIKNWKKMLMNLAFIVTTLVISATASISYINFTMSRVSWSLAPLQKYDAVVYDIGDFVSDLYSRSQGELSEESQKEEVQSNTKGEQKKETFTTQIIIPEMSVLTTGRSDIWKEYIKTSTSSAKNLLFGTRADGILIPVNGMYSVASHNSVLQIVYYYGAVGLVLICGVVLLLLFKAIKKHGFCWVNFIPAFVYCIDIMALDNLTSMRTPIFVYIVGLSLVYENQIIDDKKREKIETEDKISVIIPAYNAEKTIRKCLESICNQTYSNLEIIIVNDGSNDETLKIANEFKEKDSRIIVITKENGGVSSSRNKGICRSTGKYISFVDSDDYLDLDYIATLYKNIYSCDMVMCGYTEIGQDIRSVKPKSKLYEKRNFGCVLDKYYHNNIINPPWNKLFKREYLIGLKFDESISLGEDLLLNAEYLYKISSLKVIYYSGYNYIIGGPSLTRSYKIEKFDVIIELHNRLRSYFNSESNKKTLASVLIRNVCGQFRRYFKVNSISKEDKLKFVTEYMSRNEIRESLKIAKAKNLQQLIIYSLLKLKKYNAVYFILSRL